MNDGVKRWWALVRRPVILAAILTALGLSLHAGYAVWGHAIVEAAWRGKSLPVLNRLITGQATRPIAFYIGQADRLEARLVASGLGLLGIGLWWRAVSRGYRERLLTRRGLVSVSLLGLLLLFAPPVYQQLFAVCRLSVRENAVLWAFVVFGAAVLWWVHHRWSSQRYRRLLAVLLFPLAVTVVELAVRWVGNFSPLWRREMTLLADRSEPEFMRYRAHPFLHYTGNPRTNLTHHDHGLPLELGARYNSLGFIGDDFQYQRRPGVTRVACLGGSTTEAGYPALLEAYLREHAPPDRDFEVYNFGMAGWHSGHSLVNYVLNVRDFQPDYVVVHHGWNDGPQSLIDPDNPGDYSLSSKVFEPPVWPDRALYRASLLYRLVKDRLMPIPSHAVLAEATALKTTQRQTGLKPSDPSPAGYSPLQRNLRTLLALARDDAADVVLVTMPHSLADPALDSQRSALEQNNDTIRRIAKDPGPQLLFVDLAKRMTGDNRLFTDLAHCTQEGDRRKAELIGAAILSDPSHPRTHVEQIDPVREP